MTTCNDRRRFAEQFALAAREYFEAVTRLVQHEGPPAQAEYDALRSIVIEAQERCGCAGVEFVQHVATHGCAVFTNKSAVVASTFVTANAEYDGYERHPSPIHRVNSPARPELQNLQTAPRSNQ
jgi:hypothetical protein